MKKPVIIFCLYFSAIISYLCIVSCAKNEHECISICLIESIEDIISRNCHGEASITKYLFQNRIVYFINPGECWSHQTYKVVDSNCNIIGEYGRMKDYSIVNGEDFDEHAIKLEIIWKR